MNLCRRHPLLLVTNAVSLATMLRNALVVRVVVLVVGVVNTVHIPNRPAGRRFRRDRSARGPRRKACSITGPKLSREKGNINTLISLGETNAVTWDRRAPDKHMEGDGLTTTAGMSLELRHSYPLRNYNVAVTIASVSRAASQAMLWPLAPSEILILRDNMRHIAK